MRKPVVNPHAKYRKFYRHARIIKPRSHCLRQSEPQHCASLLPFSGKVSINYVLRRPSDPCSGTNDGNGLVVLWSDEEKNWLVGSATAPTWPRPLRLPGPGHCLLNSLTNDGPKCQANASLVQCNHVKHI